MHRIRCIYFCELRFELLSRTVEDSLWSAGEEFEFDEDGNIVGMSIS